MSGGASRSGGSTRSAGGLADFVQEALEQEGLEADQGFRPVRLGDEGVRHTFGAERDEPAGSDRRSSPT